MSCFYGPCKWWMGNILQQGNGDTGVMVNNVVPCVLGCTAHTSNVHWILIWLRITNWGIRHHCLTREFYVDMQASIHNYNETSEQKPGKYVRCQMENGMHEYTPTIRNNGDVTLYLCVIVQRNAWDCVTLFHGWQSQMSIPIMPVDFVSFSYYTTLCLNELN